MKLLTALLAASTCFANVGAGLRAHDRRDFSAAFREWSADAARGDRKAQYHLGLLYRDGEGVSRDLSKSFDLIGRSARQGYAPAQAEFGRFLRKGLAGPADPVQARQWLQRGADQGQSLSMNELGLMYLNGQGGPVDYPRALQLFVKASPQSSAALSNVALMHEMGWGVPKSIVEACAWYTVAAEEGSKNAPSERDYNCGALPAADRKLAKKRVASIHRSRAFSWLGSNGMLWTGILRSFWAFIAGIYFLAHYALSRYGWLSRGLPSDAHQRYLERTRSRVRRWFLWYPPSGSVAWVLHQIFHLALVISLALFAALATLPFDIPSLLFGLILLLALTLSHAVAVWRDKRVFWRTSTQQPFATPADNP